MAAARERLDRLQTQPSASARLLAASTAWWRRFLPPSQTPAPAGLSRNQRDCCRWPAKVFRSEISRPSPEPTSFDVHRAKGRSTSKVTVEVWPISAGKITHEFEPININAVPYMMTLGGQSFAKAYGQIGFGSTAAANARFWRPEDALATLRAVDGTAIL